MDQILYRFYDREGVLLYVGITMDAPQRFRWHRHAQEWFRQIDHVDFAHYPDRASVLLAERDAIRRERPLYNISQNVSGPPTPSTVRWACDVCGQRIKARTGYIHVDYCAAMKLWPGQPVSDDRSVSVDELPELVRWQVHHRACDPEPNTAEFWIDVGQWSTSDQALEWAAHLSEKEWVGNTDLAALLRRSKTPPRHRRTKVRAAPEITEADAHAPEGESHGPHSRRS